MTTLDDSITGFSPEFPYAALREQILSKCEAAGLKFDRANGEPRPEMALSQAEFIGFPGRR